MSSRATMKWVIEPADTLDLVHEQPADVGGRESGRSPDFASEVPRTALVSRKGLRLPIARGGVRTSTLRRHARRYGRPLLEIDPADSWAAVGIVDWLRAAPTETLSVGGPSESTQPGIGAAAYAVLVDVFGRLALP